MNHILQTFLGLMWLALIFVGGYFCSGYIIRWNEKHLTGKNIDPHRLWAAMETNADYRLESGRSIKGLRIVMTILAPITIVKAVFLRMRGGAL